MQQIVLVVKAQTSGEAKDILDRIGIKKDSSDKFEAMSEQLFLVTIKRGKQIGPQIYANINKSLKIGILSDSSSRERAEEVFRAVYEVEIQLRKLLLYLPDLVETYYDILLQHGKYLDKCKSKDTENSLIFKKNLDTLVSYLTLGEIIEILGYDFSWSSHQPTASDLNELLNSSSSFDDFKTKFNEKGKVTLVWDVITKEVLRKDLSWEDMKDKLSNLKKYRDAAAHHNHFTEKKKEAAIKLAKEVEEYVKPLAPLSSKQQAQLKTFNKQIADGLRISIQNSLSVIKGVNESMTQSIKDLNEVFLRRSTFSTLSFVQRSAQSSTLKLEGDRYIDNESIEDETRDLCKDKDKKD